MYDAVLQNIIEKFHENSENARAVILHPSSKHRTALVAHLLTSEEYIPLYYALTPESGDLEVFIDSMLRSFAEQHDEIGRYASAAHAQFHRGVNAFRDAAIEGLVRDFQSLDGMRTLVIFDNFDYAENAEDVQRFVEELIVKLPENCLAVINGRSQPRFPWNSLIAQTRAIILDDDKVVTQTLQPSFENPIGQLDIFAIGPGFVYFDDKQITDWEGHLPRLLLFFAVDRGVITREDFHRAFWGDLSDVQATNVFHVTKRRLHRAFNMEMLEHQDGNYRLRPGISVYYDAFEWTQALIRARDVNNQDPAKDYERVLELYRGPFLKGHDDAWILTRRQDVLAGFIEAVIYLAEMYAGHYRADRKDSSTSLEKAITLCRDALKEASASAELAVKTAGLLAEFGRRVEAYEVLKAYEAATKGTPPDERVKEMLTALKKSR
jgi:hypothetical protein